MDCASLKMYRLAAQSLLVQDSRLAVVVIDASYCLWFFGIIGNGNTMMLATIAAAVRISVLLSIKSFCLTFSGTGLET